MRIGLQTWGSEGDIRPFVALGAALAGRGHRVELLYTEIADRRYEHVAQALGFTARAIASPVIPEREEQYRLGLEAINARDPLRQGLIIFRRILEPVVDPIYEAALDLCRRSDLVVQHFILHPARAAADLAGTPLITLAFAHMLTPSRHIHPTGLPRLGDWGNAIEWKIARFALNQTLLTDVNRFRARVGLRGFDDLLLDGWASHRLHLLAASPALMARPADWPAWNRMCGFLELPPHEGETVSPEVDAFIAAGEAPVFMGFGSLMPVSGPHLDDTVAVFSEAARRAGCRAIIQAEIDAPSTDRMLFVRRTPHRLVFPRCAAVVHHAGAGTTHTTLRAGVPSIAVPHVSDQFQWADELERLGVAPKQLRRTRLSARRLADRLAAVLGNEAMKRSALKMAERMRHDNGAETAADMIESSSHDARELE